ncbi:hypothetical protein BDZ91DRAFT_827214 [Kalaharituber pfeilii]|nr:hypothetical protein BDZ91DRAFT_827214 [Kalaharituber pfeilii]
MYTLHKSIIAFLLFFITTILACPPPQNENASQWGFGPDDISIENIISARSACSSSKVRVLPTLDAIEISFDPIPYVDVGPGLSPNRATWVCFVNFKLKSPKSFKPVFERVRYGVDYSLDNNMRFNQDTFVYIGPGPEDHHIESSQDGPDSVSGFCVDDPLGPPVAGTCGPEKTSVGVRVRLTIDKGGNQNGFGSLQVNSPYYLGLDWEFCP